MGGAVHRVGDGPPSRRTGAAGVGAERRGPMTTWSRLRERAAAGNEITVGVIGAGYVGRGLVHLLDRLDGFRPAVVVNRTVARGIDAFAFAGHDAADVVTADKQRDLQDAVDGGRPAVTADYELALALR